MLCEGTTALRVGSEESDAKLMAAKRDLGTQEKAKEEVRALTEATSLGVFGSTSI